MDKLPLLGERERTMTKKTRRKIDAALKAKIAMEARKLLMQTEIICRLG